MTKRYAKSTRDPAAKKKRDLARQRKVSANGSDKAARRHIRTIKAMENRKIRRIDKVALSEEHDDSADQINLDHRTKLRHWGSDNAAERRAANRATRARHERVGGRRAVQAIATQDLLARTDNAAVVKMLNETLARLNARKKSKD